MLLMLPIGGALLVLLELVTTVEIVLLRASNLLNNVVTNLWVVLYNGINCCSTCFVDLWLLVIYVRRFMLQLLEVLRTVL